MLGHAYATPRLCEATLMLGRLRYLRLRYRLNTTTLLIQYHYATDSVPLRYNFSYKHAFFETDGKYLNWLSIFKLTGYI